MPANPSVTVTVYLQSLPALTTSYTFQLVNPMPTVTSASPTVLETGGSQTVTLTGSGFVPGTTVLLNGAAFPINYISYTQATVQVPVAANATGTLSPAGPKSCARGRSGNDLHRKRRAYLNRADCDRCGRRPTPAQRIVDFTVDMSAAVTGSMQTAVNWSWSARRCHISNAGVYTASDDMPATHTSPSRRRWPPIRRLPPRMPVNVINPVPAITAASPAIVPPGQPPRSP